MTYPKNIIKENFSKKFILLFKCGHASLELIGDPNPFKSDIRINARPLRKRNTSIRFLSSVEKALTRIGLLSYIYQLRSSPYCISDEFESPVYGLNVEKFARSLKSFRYKTKFITVTHNKLTMKIADYLYGVSQANHGISKLVSVNFL